MTTTKKISKAELKRRKDRRNRISHLIRTNLIDFKDIYLGDYADYKKRVIENEKAKWVAISTEETLKAYNDKREKEFNEYYSRSSYRSFYPTNMSTVTWNIEKCDKELSTPTLNKFKWFTEAHEGYETKIEKVIDKVDRYEMSTRFMKIERINDAGHAFSFLISNEEMEVHARVIYACGEINAPHYRFIVTKRNKK
jgi:hypothetical protein